MQRGKSFIGLLVFSLIFFGVTQPARADETTRLKLCGELSSLLCIEKVEMSLDNKLTWQQLESVDPGVYYDWAFFRLTGTGFQSADPNVNVLVIDFELKEYDESPYSSRVDVIHLSARAENQTTQTTNFNGQPMDPRAYFKFTLRIGKVNPTAYGGNAQEVNITKTLGPEFNTLVFEGKSLPTAQFDGFQNQATYLAKCKSKALLAADYLNNSFSFSATDYLGREWSFTDVSLFSNSSCGGSLIIADDPRAKKLFIYLIVGASAPHFLPDKKTPNKGHIELLLTPWFLATRMGLTTESALAGGLAASTNYGGKKETPLVISVVPAQDGAVRLIIDGYHYSSPKVTIKRTSKSKKPVRVNGKSVSISTSQIVSGRDLSNLMNASTPSKATFQVSISKSDKKSGICFIKKNKLITSGRTGSCTVTLKVSPGKVSGTKIKPAPVYTTSTITVS